MQLYYAWEFYRILFYVVTGFGLSGCYSYHFDICFILINTCALFRTTPIHFMNGL